MWVWVIVRLPPCSKSSAGQQINGRSAQWESSFHTFFLQLSPLSLRFSLRCLALLRLLSHPLCQVIALIGKQQNLEKSRLSLGERRRSNSLFSLFLSRGPRSGRLLDWSCARRSDPLGLSGGETCPLVDGGAQHYLALGRPPLENLAIDFLSFLLSLFFSFQSSLILPRR